MARNAPRGSMVCLGNGAPLLSGRHEAGPQFQPPSPLTAPASVGTERDYQQSEHVPVCCIFLLVSAATGTLRTSQLWPHYPYLA